MSRKPPVDLAIWQWALIGSGCTLLLASAAYGAFNLITNSQSSGTISKNTPVQIKSADVKTSPSLSGNSDTNVAPTVSNTSDKVAQNPANNSIAGTWLFKTSSAINGKDTFEVVITNDSRLIMPDAYDSSRGIEGAANIRTTSANSNARSSDAISAVAGTWLFDWQGVEPNGTFQAIIASDGVVTIINSARSYRQEIGKIIRKVSDNTNVPFANVISVVDSFKEQAAKVRQSEARVYVGSMNRTQQAFYLEKNRFASSLNLLQIGIKSETDNYSYRVSSVDSLNSFRRVTYQIGQAKQTGLKSYIGAVRVARQDGNTITVSVLCETNTPSTSQPPLPVLVGDDKLECASGTQEK